PGNNGSLSTAIFLRQFHFWVKVSNASLGLIAHPFAIVANIISQPLCAVPITSHERCLSVWINGWTSGKLWRDFNQSFGNQYCDRIEITGMGFQTKALCFQRD